jgi:hypothetical protein
MLRSAPLFAVSCAASRGRNGRGIRTDPGSAEQREERCTVSGTRNRNKKGGHLKWSPFSQFA